MLILLGSQEDPHLHLVSSALDDLGVEHRLVDHNRPSAVSLTLPAAQFRLDGQQIAFEAIDLVWSRTKILYQRYGDGPEYLNQFLWGRGWSSFVNELDAVLGDRVVNSLASVRDASDKIKQLLVAHRLGVTVPASIVSNDADEILAWGSQHPSTIIKPLGDPGIPNIHKPYGQTMFMTTRVKWPLFAERREGVAVFPNLYQEEIRKRLELRVAVQGEAIFGFGVDSQKRKFTEVDWRYGTNLKIFSPFDLPDEIEAFCRAYLRRYGLFCGHFDFIVTPEDDYVFLECNPQGQWAWLDELVGGAMSRQFAAELVNKAKAVGAAQLREAKRGVA